MHLTGLSNTALDNPMHLTKETLISEMQEFLVTDTLCYLSEEPEDLVELQGRSWSPVTDWFQERFDCKLNITKELFSSGHPPESLAKIERHLNSYDQKCLVGLQFIAENLKSLVLTLALAEKRIGVLEAVSLGRLETEFQIAKWGRVEWHHDLDVMQTRTRVAAGLLFVFFNSEQTKTTSKLRKS